MGLLEMAGQSFFYFFCDFSAQKFLFLHIFVYLYSMKKLFLFALIIILGAQLTAESVPHFEVYFDDDCTGGMRLTTNFSDLRLTTRPHKQNFGAAVFTSNILPRLPLTVKTGNLSAGGALSLLNNPELSAGSSPFTSSVTSTQVLTASLPGYTSFSKPVSTFFEFSTPKTKSAVSRLFPIKINTWLTEQASSPVTSLAITFPPLPPYLNFSISYIGGFFYYNSNSTSSWFLKSPYYPSGNHYCGLLQFSTQIKKSKNQSFLLNLTTALYESPFGFYQLIYRADAKLTTKHTNLFSQIYYNPYDNLLTSSEKTLSPGLQLKTGFLYKTPSKLASLYFKTPVFLRAGTNVYLKLNLTQPEHPLKVNAGLQFSTEKTTQAFSLSADGKLISKKPESPPQDFTLKTITTQLKSTWKLGTFTPALTLNLTLPQNQASSKKYKITASTGYQSKSKNTPLKINATTTISGTPDNKEELKISSSLSLHLKIKYLTLTGKISFNEDIEF